MLDGVYVDGDEAPVFVSAPPLSDQTVRQIVETSARRIIRLCSRHGLLDDTQADPLADEEPVLAALVPPPRLHLLRYHGVLAPRARDRGTHRADQAGCRRRRTAYERSVLPHRLGWACWRGCASDLSARCGGRLRIVAALTDPDPDLSGGGRAAGGASAEGPAAAAVRVRRLISSAIRSLRREP